jgi:DNA-binding LytR/AlgR family response regulator
MEKFNCIILEDEPLAAEILQDYINQVPFLKHTQTCRDAIYAMQILQTEKIDVLFLDIHLPKIKGLDFLRMLKTPPRVIITTAHRDYALDGYELNVLDYLLKPISLDRFLSAVNKLEKNNTPNTPSAPAVSANNEAAFLLININKKKIKVFEKDILFIESRREYVYIMTAATSYLTKCTLTEMEMQLNTKSFLRVHRSFLIPVEKVNAFTSVALEIGQHTVPIGRSYRDTVKKTLGNSKA